MAKQPRPCECGCGEMTKGGRFRPGHDARAHGQAKKSKMAEAINHRAREVVGTSVEKETAYRRPSPSTGNGPACPLAREHGRTMRIRGAEGWFCPHAEHGGNGRFFTQDEVDGRRAPDPDQPLPRAVRTRN